MPLNEGYAYREQLGPRAHGQRSLWYLVSKYRHSSAQDWRERVARGEVTLDGAPIDGHEILQAGQVLVWNRPPWDEEATPRTFDIAYLDDALLAVIKPSGLPTMHGGGFLENTLLSLVRAQHPEATPLHRLGRATSGLVLFARTHAAASRLSEAWRMHHVEKRYRALASGVLAQDRVTIEAPIGPVPHPRLGTVHGVSATGKASRSVACVLERREDATLLQVDIFTGRPHQIRIHTAFLGHPLVGDPLYGPGGQPKADNPGLPGDGGYLLHAERLAFTHPVTGAPLDVYAPAPPALRCAGE
ncbi:RluA family pseudouridine synthase [Deinococcus maricopensis]|uniref:RluA family pseudouridine synthase n=1 Tax=Deinococcus maricopensis TaxID=309887 RepID=UPI0011D2A009|nr:RluA family pseudouridine synthase [Deinococcus maricopensis]